MRKVERRIRIASILVILGLLIECVTFAWKSPLAFFLFMFVGCGVAVVGISVFLLSLISPDQNSPS